MRRTQLGIVFGSLLLVALVLFMPLGFALTALGAGKTGLAARKAQGTIWSGRLVDARLGQVALGDAEVGLYPFPLLTGRARAWLRGPVGHGALVMETGRRGFDDARVRLSTPGLFGPVPLAGIELDSVSAAFRGNRCEKAGGRVRATFAGEVAGLSLAQGLSGLSRCEGGVLLLPLVSQSTMERLNLRIAGDGSYRAEFIVRSTDPVLNGKLIGSGFSTMQSGYVLRFNGSF